MGKLTLHWTNTSLSQRNHIFSYWNKRNRSTEYSKRLLKVINERTKLILLFPKIGRENHRVIPLEHYSIFYRKVDDKIIITAFWDNNQNPKELLLLLK
jgi:plasmid stabilization system protein ParE